MWFLTLKKKINIYKYMTKMKAFSELSIHILYPRAWVAPFATNIEIKIEIFFNKGRNFVLFRNAPQEMSPVRL